MHDRLTTEENDDGVSRTGVEETACDSAQAVCEGQGGSYDFPRFQTGSIIPLPPGTAIPIPTGVDPRNFRPGVSYAKTGGVWHAYNQSGGLQPVDLSNASIIATHDPSGFYYQGLALLGQTQAQQAIQWYGNAISVHGWPKIEEVQKLDLKTEVCPGEIVAYRVWRVDQDLNLLSMTNDTRWDTGDLVSPVDDYWQGFHCWKKMDDARQYCMERSCRPRAVGAVEIWGEVIEHDDGYRAEFASVRSVDELYGISPLYRFLRTPLEKLRAKYNK